MAHKVVAAVSKIVAAAPPKIGQELLNALLTETQESNVDKVWKPVIDFLKAELGKKVQFGADFRVVSSVSGNWRNSTLEISVLGSEHSPLDYEGNAGLTVWMNEKNAKVSWIFREAARPTSSGDWKEGDRKEFKLDGANVDMLLSKMLAGLVKSIKKLQADGYLLAPGEKPIKRKAARINPSTKG